MNLGLHRGPAQKVILRIKGTLNAATRNVGFKKVNFIICISIRDKQP